MKKHSQGGEINNVNIYEYSKGDWTYHAKGAWVYERLGKDLEEELPTMTVVGSSNFSHRSNRRDTEVQAYLVPALDNLEFRQRLHDECDNLFKHGKQMSIEDLKDKKGEQYKLTWKDKIIQKLFSFAL